MMKMIDRLLETVGKKNFHLDQAIGMTYILKLCWKYGWMMVRGKLFSLGRKNISRKIFVGKNVRILEKKHLSIGEKSRLQDGVYIDALSKEGVQIGCHVVIGQNARIECTGGLQSIGAAAIMLVAVFDPVNTKSKMAAISIIIYSLLPTFSPFSVNHNKKIIIAT